jgi:glycosyltransferase involved in cell wall biosynthesis
LAIQGRVLSGVSLRLYSQKSVFPGIAGRLLAVFIFPYFFHRVMSDFKPDIVVSFAVPTSGWQAAIICRVLSRPLLFRALDVSHKIRKSMFAPLIRAAEKLVYSSAAWVSCNNLAMFGYCASLGAKEGKSSVDFPPLDLSHFLKGSSRNVIRSKLGIPNASQVILYMGSFFYFSGLADVLKKLALMTERPILVLIGGGEQDAELRSITKMLHLEDCVKFTGYIEFDDLPLYLSMADVAINPMEPSMVSNNALPNKVLQYMAAGLPVVTTKLDGLSSIFEDQGGVQSVSIRPCSI